MKKLLSSLSAVLLLAACTSAPTAMEQGDDHSMHSESSGANSQGMSADRLTNSPRHQEWVEVKNGDKTIYTWVVYPQTSGKVPVVVLIHENKGLNDWARGMADQVAEAGYIAVAPDLLSEFSDTMTRTSDFPTADDATKAIGQLKPDQVQSDLKAVAQWAETIPSSNGKLAAAGFCWGGGQSFAMAVNNDDLDATLVFYGTGPTDANDYARIKSPVYGFYGGADERVTSTVALSNKLMSDAGKTYTTVTYDGAGHAFMRLGEDPNGDAANVAARNAAWTSMKDILSKL
jgi:carboxymethylenebutenolidase